MAGANLPAKKYTKTSPTVTRLSFECTGGATQFIDVAMALSIINRKFYRQGVYYYVNSVEVYNDETGVVDLHTLPDNWITKNAHSRGFQLFQKMNSLVDSVSAVGRPKYHDFKIYMNDLHRTTGSKSPSTYSINATYTNRNADDWVYSVFTSADDDQDGTANADEFNVHMIGGHTGPADGSNWESIGLIKSYRDSRITVQATAPNDSNVRPEDPLINIFDFSSEEQMNDIVENLQTDNDAPPYDMNNYLGESEYSLQHVARIGTEQGVGRIGRASGFCAPLGLICIDPHGVSTNFRVVLNLAVGTYHGVYAERA
jgi:hypothetical protein